jgi:hypothetical protein
LPGIAMGAADGGIHTHPGAVAAEVVGQRAAVDLSNLLTGP